MHPQPRAVIAAFASTVLVGLVAPGCGDSSSAPADASGVYGASITNREDGCNFGNTPGPVGGIVNFTIRQSGSDATGTADGGVGTLLQIALGSSTFEGSVSGNTVTMTLYGTRSATTGNCTYTVNATLTGTLQGDALQGHIDYTKAGNGNPDCVGVTGCITRQDFSGSRHPK